MRLMLLLRRDDGGGGRLLRNVVQKKNEMKTKRRCITKKMGIGMGVVVVVLVVILEINCPRSPRSDSTCAFDDLGVCWNGME